MPGRERLKKFHVYVVDTDTSFLAEDADSLTISRKEYSGTLGLLSSHNALDAILNSQTFRCGLCRSFFSPRRSSVCCIGENTIR